MAKTSVIDATTLKKYSNWFLVYGLGCAILGALAIIWPNLATVAVEQTIGWLLVIVGVMGLIAGFSGGLSAPGFWWNLLVAILYLLAGIALLWHPVAGEVTLTFILVAYLLAGGLIKLVMAFNIRKFVAKAWGYMLLSGLVDIVLAVMILSGWPGTAAWVVGLIVGINLLMTGIALIVVSINSRNLDSVTIRTS